MFMMMVAIRVGTWWNENFNDRNHSAKLLDACATYWFCNVLLFFSEVKELKCLLPNMTHLTKSFLATKSFFAPHPFREVSVHGQCDDPVKAKEETKDVLKPIPLSNND